MRHRSHVICVIYGLHSIYVVFGIHGDPGVGSRLMVRTHKTTTQTQIKDARSQFHIHALFCIKVLKTGHTVGGYVFLRAEPPDRRRLLERGGLEQNHQ